MTRRRPSRPPSATERRRPGGVPSGLPRDPRDRAGGRRRAVAGPRRGGAVVPRGRRAEQRRPPRGRRRLRPGRRAPAGSRGGRVGGRRPRPRRGLLELRGPRACPPGAPPGRPPRGRRRVVTGVSSGWQKPDPRIFETVARRLDVPVADLVHVGTDPGTDGGVAAAGGRFVDARDTPLSALAADQGVAP